MKGPPVATGNADSTHLLGLLMVFAIELFQLLDAMHIVNIAKELDALGILTQLFQAIEIQHANIWFYQTP